MPTLCGATVVLGIAPLAAVLGWLLQKVEEVLKPKMDKRIGLVAEAINCAPLHTNPVSCPTLLVPRFDRS